MTNSKCATPTTMQRSHARKDNMNKFLEETTVPSVYRYSDLEQYGLQTDSVHMVPHDTSNNTSCPTTRRQFGHEESAS